MRPHPLVALALVSGLVQPACVRGQSPQPRTPIADLARFSRTGSTAMPARFWTAFGDPELDALVDEALTRGFDVATAWARLRQAAASARAAGADRYPTVTASAGGGASTSGTSSADARTSLSLGVAASYEIDLWGGLAAGRAAAAWSATAARLDVEAAAISVAAELTTRWYQRAADAARVTLLERDVAASEATLALVQARVDAGVAPDSERMSQAQAVEALRGQLATARATVITDGHAINALRGAAPDAALPAPPPTLPSLAAVPATGVPAAVLARRPDVASAWAQVEAADRAVAQAMAERYPRLSLSASLASTGQLEGWLANLAANLVAPLFDGGARAAAVDRSRAQVDAAVLAYQRAVVAAAVDVEDALVTEAAQAELVASLDRQAALAQAALAAVRQQYLAGATDQLRVLSAEQTAQNVVRSRLAAQALAITARVALYRALAGPIDVAAPADPAAEPRKSQSVAGDGRVTAGG